MTIEEVMKLNKTRNPFLKKEIQYAQSLLKANEQVMYAISAFITVILNGEINFSNKNKVAGVVVITNERVYACSIITMGQKIFKELPFNKIECVDNFSNTLFGPPQVKIKSLTETLVIECNVKNVNDLVKHIKTKDSLKENRQDKNNINAIDEILKYKELLDKGVITQEEFQKKKKELLDL